jgi:hypothetical protein
MLCSAITPSGPTSLGYTPCVSPCISLSHSMREIKDLRGSGGKCWISARLVSTCLFYGYVSAADMPYRSHLRLVCWRTPAGRSLSDLGHELLAPPLRRSPNRIPPHAAEKSIRHLDTPFPPSLKCTRSHIGFPPPGATPAPERENGRKPLRARRCSRGLPLHDATDASREGAGSGLIREPEDLAGSLISHTHSVRVRPGW